MNKSLPKWISVKDKLPDEDVYILLAYDDEIRIGALNSYVTKNISFYCRCCLDDFHGITHWMRLPAPPEKE